MSSPVSTRASVHLHINLSSYCIPPTSHFRCILAYLRLPMHSWQRVCERAWLCGRTSTSSVRRRRRGHLSSARSEFFFFLGLLLWLTSFLFQFTGSYSYSGFRQCIAINPWDYKNTANAIHQALTMSDEEASARWQVGRRPPICEVMFSQFS